MSAANKVRIYDLAKELKQDPKRIMEDLRREGADVNVPSNSVEKDLADKLRKKYAPKTEAKPKRTVKVIKKKASDSAEDSAVEAEAAEENSAAEEVAAPKKRAKKDAGEVAEVAAEPEAPESEKKTVAKVLKPKVVPAPVAPEPAPETPVEEAAPGQPGGTQVKQLTLTEDALKKGIKIGSRVTTQTAPTKTGVLSGQGRAGQGGELRGTPGENATPRMTYTPSPDSRKKFGRSSGKKGARGRDERGGRFEERDLNAPKTRSIEERIQDQVGKTEGDFKPVRLTDGATVREFAEAIGVVPKDVVQLLLSRGVIANLNNPIQEDLAVELGMSLGFDVSFVPFEEMVIEQEFEELIASDADDVELPRAPVVTVMGHVDHGKTSLLDAIRSANVAEGEAGGITQHIGAYSVFVPSPDKPDEKRRVVFLDTPGHEAFTMMRSRGAKATDVVILVVAADDGVMPQTIEAIEHSKAAGVPIIVAINKMDKPDANADRVKQGLAQHGLQPLDWGGDTEMVPVSAKKRQNLDTLLETVLLSTDILNLKASPTRLASGVVLEAKLEKGRGPVATVLIQQGTLHVGDPFIVGQFSGKVRAMFSDRGDAIKEAAPATPVEVLGLEGVPGAGDKFQVVSDVEKAQEIAGARQMHARQAAMLKTTKRGIESLGQSDVKELLVILKADVQGSVEVLKATLEKLSSEKVKVRVIRAGVGAIAESDVLLASATQADNASTAVVIIGFNVRPEARAAEVAKKEEVDIRLHSIIYKIEEEIKAAMIGMLDAIEKENILGKALVQETFKVSKVGMIAGCRVSDGLIKRQAKARLIRDAVVIWTGDIASLKRFKEDASEVKEGYECGISLVNFNDIKVGDEIEAFVIEKIAATEL